MQAFTAIIERDESQGGDAPFAVIVRRGIAVECRPGTHLAQNCQAIVLRSGEVQQAIKLSTKSPSDTSRHSFMGGNWKEDGRRGGVVLTASNNQTSARGVLARVTLPIQAGLELGWQPGGLGYSTPSARVLANVRNSKGTGFDLLVVLYTLAGPWMIDLYERESNVKWRTYLHQNRRITQPPNLTGKLIKV